MINRIFLCVSLFLLSCIPTSYAKGPNCNGQCSADVCNINGKYKGVFRYGTGDFKNEFVKVNVTGSIEKNPALPGSYHITLLGDNGVTYTFSRAGCSPHGMTIDINGYRYSGTGKEGVLRSDYLYSPAQKGMVSLPNAIDLRRVN